MKQVLLCMLLAGLMIPATAQEKVFPLHEFSLIFILLIMFIIKITLKS